MPPLFNPVRSVSPLMTISPLEAQGFTHLVVRCKTCGQSSHIPLSLTRARRNVPMAALQTKFRCDCGSKRTEVYGWATAEVHMAECAEYRFEHAQ